jgi:hypothetical protein
MLRGAASVGPAAAIVTFTTRQAAADCALNKKAYSRPAGTPAEFLAKEGNYEKSIVQSTVSEHMIALWPESDNEPARPTHSPTRPYIKCVVSSSERA